MLLCRQEKWQKYHILLYIHGQSLVTGLAQVCKVSPKATVFSTPEDLAQVELLHNSYPDTKIFVRLVYGFLLLADDVEAARALIRSKFEPLVQQHISTGQLKVDGSNVTGRKKFYSVYCAHKLYFCNT